MRQLTVQIAAVLLTACAHVPPPPDVPLLHLAPAQLGRDVMLAQRLTVLALPDAAAAAVAERSLDVQLQADAQQVQLAGIAMNQRVLRMAWDGRELRVERHALLPAEVDPERILRDLQLACWPLDAVRAALPPGWTVTDAGTARGLSYDGAEQVRVEGAAQACRSGVITIDNRREGYRLRVESRDMGDVQ